MITGASEERKYGDQVIAQLRHKLQGVIDAAIDARRRTGLEAPHPQVQRAQPARGDGWTADPPARPPWYWLRPTWMRPLPRKIPAVRTTAAASKTMPETVFHLVTSVFRSRGQPPHLLEQRQVGRVLQKSAADELAVQLPVGLSTGGAHRRILASASGAGYRRDLPARALMPPGPSISRTRCSFPMPVP